MSLNKLLSFTMLISLSLGLLACGEGYAPVSRLENKSFKVSGTSASDARTQGDDNYVIQVDRTGLDQISRPKDAPKEEQLNSELARRIQNLKISKNIVEKNRLLSEEVSVRIKLNNNTDAAQEAEVLNFTFAGMPRLNQSYIKYDASKRYALRVVCLAFECEKAWLMLGDLEKKQHAEVRYEKKIEYLTRHEVDLQKNNTAINNKLHNKLLSEALEFGYPVERHSSDVLYGQGSDILVVQRPPVDATEENFDDPTGESSVTVTAVGADIRVSSLPSENDIVELETITRTYLQAPRASPAVVEPAETNVTEPTPPVAAPPASSNKPTPTVQRPAEPAAGLKLSDDPNTHYQVVIPSQLLRVRGTQISDPLALNVNFSIKPVHEQKDFEPSYRLAVLAKAFVDQGVKIKLHACNIYVRAVMALSGYTTGGHYLANDFHRLFAHRGQDLNKWEKANFRHQKSAQNIDLLSLQARTDLIPEGYAVVVQVVRSHLGKHGHVAILTREKGELVIYDASLSRHGPRRTVVRESQILNSGRPVVNIFSMPELLRSRDTGPRPVQI